jgi:hypothetical protein
MVGPLGAQVDWRLGTPVEVATVRELPTEPVLDGRLDDGCWTAALPLSRFYAFGFDAVQQGSFPLPAALRTVARLGYTRRGLWLAFDCYDDMSRVRPRLRARDDGDLWTEDSLELYVATATNRLDFRKFTFNALGTQADMQVTSGVLDPTWSDLAWQVKTTLGADRWSAECFFPWTSLGSHPRTGDCLPFGITRFSWTSGKLVAACWGAGMSHPFIYRAGMLLFDVDLAGLLTGIADLESRWRGPTWHLWSGDYLIAVSDAATETRRLLAEVAGVLGDIEFALNLALALPGRDAEAKSLEELRASLKVLVAQPQQEISRETWREANVLLRQARDLRDEVRRDLLLCGSPLAAQ